MKIKKLFADVPDVIIKGPKDIKITGISANSKTVAPGNLFLARKGKTFDGAEFISEAVLAGASAVLTDLYNPFLSQIAQIIHPNAAVLEAKIAAAFYGFPSKKLYTIGVTGTNGKTTVSYLIRHIFEQNNKPCGLLSTIEYISGKSHHSAMLTTPAAVDLQKFLKEMVNSKMKAVVMEASSQALDQLRCQEIDFSLAIFTNLTQDHLDYHLNMQNYAKAKERLFQGLGLKSAAIVNADDPYVENIIQNTKAKVVTYGLEKPAHLRAENIVFSETGTEFDLAYAGKIEKISSSLVGRFNVYNLLAAIAAALEAKIPLKKIKQAVASFAPVRGRLERAKIKQPFSVFVDYAHTEDALINALAALKQFKKGRLIVVFGCGGNRDKDKRPKMGRAASENADFCILTSDNPRQEDGFQIIQDIVRGIQKENYLIEEDRFLAIKKAVLMAKENDIVLIAGKGHETYQILKDKKYPFDDRGAVEEICQNFLK